MTVTPPHVPTPARAADIDLGAWARRRDSGWLSARVEDGAVRVAEVVR